MCPFVSRVAVADPTRRRPLAHVDSRPHLPRVQEGVLVAGHQAREGDLAAQNRVLGLGGSGRHGHGKQKRGNPPSHERGQLRGEGGRDGVVYVGVAADVSRLQPELVQRLEVLPLTLGPQKVIPLAPLQLLLLADQLGRDARVLLPRVLKALQDGLLGEVVRRAQVVSGMGNPHEGSRQIGVALERRPELRGGLVGEGVLVLGFFVRRVAAVAGGVERGHGLGRMANFAFILLGINVLNRLSAAFLLGFKVVSCVLVFRGVVHVAFVLGCFWFHFVVFF